MNHDVRMQELQLKRVPRERGDEPAIADANAERVKCSPRARG